MVLKRPVDTWVNILAKPSQHPLVLMFFFEPSEKIFGVKVFLFMTTALSSY